jgi:choline kinase
MLTCEICGRTFKTTQGLAGHKRLRHETSKSADETITTILGRQLHRKILNRLSDKLADRLAEAIIQIKGRDVWDAYLEEILRRELDLSSLAVYPKVKAIIIAAGESNLLLPLTKDKPECLLEVGNKTILSRQLENLRACGIHDIVVVRGYQGDKISYPGIRYYENSDYKNTGILKSFFYAKDEMDNDFIFGYSDILYTKEVLELLLRDPSDIALAVDTDWRNHYLKRHQHPISDAELVRVEGYRITQIGKGIIPPNEAHGEFIGLAKFKKSGAETLKKVHDWATQNYQSKVFHTTPSIDKAYFTDLIQEVIDQGYPVRHVDIHGGWAEIDTLEDFNKVSRKLDSILKIG